MATDGSIIFDTKIDVDGFNKGTKNLSSKVIDLKNKVNQTTREIKSLQSELEEMADTHIKTNISAGIEKDIAKAKEQLKSLYAKADEIGNSKQKDLSDLGLGTEHLDSMLSNDKDWNKVQQQITETENKLNEYETKLKSVQSAENSTTGKDTAEYKEKQEKLTRLNEQLNTYKARLRETESKEKKERKSTSLITKGFKKFKSVLSSVSKTLGGALKNGLSKAGSLIKKVGSSAKKSSSQAGFFSKSLRMLKQALAGMLLYQGISKIFDAAKESMGNLSQFSPEVNTNLSTLMSSLTQLKNTFATAFAPILSVVTPILNSFIQLLTGAVDKVAQFMFALTGSTTYTKATKVQQDYAKSVADTTENTKENTKATKENQKNLAGYDQLNVMEQSSNDDTSSSKKADNALSPKDMFKQANISSSIGDFAKQVKDLFAKGDYSGIGKLISSKINSALSSIDWKSIRGKAKGWAKNIADFFNGAVKELNWNLVGSTFANGLMTIFDFANTFLTTFDFSALGEGLANALAGFFQTMDWAVVGQTFANAFMGIFNFLYSFLTTFDFTALGEAFATMFNNFFTTMDWTIVGGTLGAGIQSIISSAFGFVESLDWSELGTSISDFINGFFNEIDWSMAAKTISDGAVGLITTLRTAIANTDWEQIGEDIGTFLANIDWWGIITGLIDLIGSAVDGLFDLVIGFIKGLGFAKWLNDNLGIDLVGCFETAKNIFGGLIDFISNVFKGNWSDAWESIKSVFDSVWKGLFNLVRIPINWIIDGINFLWSGIYSAVKGIVDTIGSVAGAIGDVFGQDWHFSMPDEPPLIPHVPALATGTVVPANYGEFLAVLGDNKRETEVVSPLSTMKQAFLEAMAEGNFGGNDKDINLTINLDGEVIFKGMVNKDSDYRKRFGKSAFA